MRFELILAVIGAGTVGACAMAVVCLVTYAVVDRVRYGRWWWDEAADGLESGRD